MISMAEKLRREFDASFAAPRADTTEEREVFLAIRVGDRPYAFRIRELSGTVVSPRLTPVPSTDRALLGLVAIRGAIVPVFDLAQILGEESTNRTARWIALSANPVSLAFAFSDLDGHLDLTRSALGPIMGSEKRWASEVIREKTALRPVLKMEALAFAVRRPVVVERQGKGG